MSVIFSKLEIEDNLDGSLLLFWTATPAADSYNMYVNGALWPQVTWNPQGYFAFGISGFGLAPFGSNSASVLVFGLTVESYSNSAISASTGNSLRPQNMPPVGVVTPSGTYNIHVTAVVGGIEVSRSASRRVTVNPSSIMLKTPMRRPFPFPSTGSPDG